MKYVLGAVALLVSGMMLVASPASASPIIYSYTTTAADLGPGAGVNYTLELNGGAATFSVTGNASSLPIWYMGWATFKLNQPPDSPVDLSGLVSSPSTDWFLADHNTNNLTKVLQGVNTNDSASTPPPSGAFSDLLTNIRESGLYDPDISSLGCTTQTAVGCIQNTGGGDTLYLDVILSSGNTWEFTFNISGVVDDDNGVIPFKVGMYTIELTGPPNNRKPKVTRNLLSADLVRQVPEPASVALLGIGVLALAGLATWRRRKHPKA